MNQIPSTTFNEINNRDAWSTIRGFVYQVNFTILRWLELDDHTILELDRGEDIDIVNIDLQSNEQSRELQQIKFRESNVSLNQELALELLKNHYTHIVNNPGLKIKFRFVTNAAYTT